MRIGGQPSGWFGGVSCVPCAYISFQIFQCPCVSRVRVCQLCEMFLYLCTWSKIILWVQVPMKSASLVVRVKICFWGSSLAFLPCSSPRCQHLLFLHRCVVLSQSSCSILAAWWAFRKKPNFKQKGNDSINYEYQSIPSTLLSLTSPPFCRKPAKSSVIPCPWSPLWGVRSSWCPSAASTRHTLACHTKQHRANKQKDRQYIAITM